MFLSLQRALGRGQHVHQTKEQKKAAKHSGHMYALIWLIWLAGGTLWYGFMPESNLGLLQGFFMAVNVGYSIGYGFPAEPHVPYLWFSIVYVLIGSSFVAFALGFFADKIIEDADNWFTNLLQRQEFEANMAPDKPIHVRVMAFVNYHREAFRALALFFFWIGLMVLYSMVHVGWPFVEGLYFAISSCSTGGHYGIPNDSPDWLFFVTGVFDAIGAPLMAVSLASIASLMIDRGDIEDVKETIAEDVTPEELLMLQRFGLENGDGEIDRAEFIILCMVRMGTDPRTIEFVSERFHELDKDGGGTLSLKEITGGKVEDINHHVAKDLHSRDASELLKQMNSSRSSRSLKVDAAIVPAGSSGAAPSAPVGNSNNMKGEERAKPTTSPTMTAQQVRPSRFEQPSRTTLDSPPSASSTTMAGGRSGISNSNNVIDPYSANVAGRSTGPPSESDVESQDSNTWV